MHKQDKKKAIAHEILDYKQSMRRHARYKQIVSIV